MICQLVIDHLKTEAPIFGGRVAGAADFTADAETSRMALPSAFVIRASGEASDAATMGEVVQQLSEDITIVITIDNSVDAYGNSAIGHLDQALLEIRLALLGWEPDANHNSFIMVRDDHVNMDRARLWHQVVYRTQRSIASYDVD